MGRHKQDKRAKWWKGVEVYLRHEAEIRQAVKDERAALSCIRAAEISAEGKSIYKHDPKGKVAEAYRQLTKDILADAQKRRKKMLEPSL